MKKLGYLILGFLLALPIGAVALQGVDLSSTNTGVTDDAWTTFAPALSCGTATFTLTSATTKTVGKQSYLQLDFTVSAIGTCTTPILFTAPKAPKNALTLSGITNNAGVVFGCLMTAGSTSVSCLKNAAAAFGVNDHLTMSGVFEVP